MIVCGSREMRAKRQVVEGVISQIKLFNAYPEGLLKGEPGTLIARRDNAVCIGTWDGALLYRLAFLALLMGKVL